MLFYAAEVRAAEARNAFLAADARVVAHVIDVASMLSYGVVVVITAGIIAIT